MDSFIGLLTLVVLCFLFSHSGFVKGQSVDDYRSYTTGNWSTPGSWERYNGIAWEICDGIGEKTSPTSADGNILIRSGHTLTITSGVTIDQVIIDFGGSVIHGSGSGTVTLNNGSEGYDLRVNGTWVRNTGAYTISIGSGATICIGDEGVYEHGSNAGGGSIPIAIWHPNSLLKCTGYPGTTGQNQTFGRVEFNYSSGSSSFVPQNIANEIRVISGTWIPSGHFTMDGDFIQTGGKVVFNKGASDTTRINGLMNIQGADSTILYHLELAGNYLQTGGNVSVSNEYNVNRKTIIFGDFLLTGGRFFLNSAISQGDVSSVTIDVRGNFALDGGVLCFPLDPGTKIAGRIMVSKDINLLSGSFGGWMSNFTATAGIYLQGSGKQILNNKFILNSGDARNSFYYKTTDGPTSIEENYYGTSKQYSINGKFGTPLTGFSRWDTTATGSKISKITINNSSGLELRDGRNVNDTLFRTIGSITGTGVISFASGATLVYNGISEIASEDKEFPATNGPSNLQINNAGSVVLHADRIIPGILEFKNGLLTTGSNKIIIAHGASVIGSNINRYINGICRKIGNTPFVFPVGNGGVYAPIGISAPANTTDHFTANYIRSSPNVLYNRSLKEITLNHVSDCEYWMLNRTNGVSNVDVTLSWDERSCGVSTLSELRVSRWNGFLWTDEGNSSTTGNDSIGTVTSDIVSDFSPFTLSSSTSANVLPVGLMDFDVQCKENGVLVSWKTASELNCKEFRVETSENAFDWNSIGLVSAHGSSNQMISYQYFVDEIYNKPFYYRLKMVDYDNGSIYSAVKFVDCGLLNNDVGFLVCPNPNKGSFKLVFNMSANIIAIHVYNALGAIVFADRISDCQIIELDLSDYGKGVYFVHVLIGDKLTVKKIVLE